MPRSDDRLESVFGVGFQQTFEEFLSQFLSGLLVVAVGALYSGDSTESMEGS